MTDHSNTGMTFEIVDMLVTSAEKAVGSEYLFVPFRLFYTSLYTTYQIYLLLKAGTSPPTHQKKHVLVG